MKRSEMLKKMKQSIQDAGYYIDDVMAEVILNVVESEGMIPPKVLFEEQRIDSGGVENGFYVEPTPYVVSFHKNEWEPEDDFFC